MPGYIETQDAKTVIIFGVASAELHTDRIARLQQTPAQVVIVDPLLDPAAPPAHVLRGREATSIIDCMIGPDSGEAMVSVWSVPGLVGLQNPTPALQALFPGLRCKRSHAVRTESLATLAGRLSHLPGPFAIWIDMPGAEGAILDALAATDLWSQAQSLSIRSGTDVFFEAAPKAENLIALMKAQGFALAGRDEQDPDFPDLHFEIDLKERQLTELKASLQAATQARAEAEATAARVLQRHRDEFDTVAGRLSALEAELQTAAQAREAAETRAQAEITERDARLSALEAELQTAAQAREAAEARAQAEITERDARLSALEAELQTAAQAREAAETRAQAEITERDAQRAALAAELRSRDAELDESQRALSALRLEHRQALDTAEARQRDLETTSASLAQTRTELTQARDMITAQNQQIAERDDRLSALDADLQAATREREALRGAQSFTDRLRAMLQLDLDNLRQRLEVSETQRIRQETLLRKLTPKLAQAAEHLKQLHLAEPVVSPGGEDGAPSGPARAASTLTPPRKAPGAPRGRATTRSDR